MKKKKNEKKTSCSCGFIEDVYILYIILKYCSVLWNFLLTRIVNCRGCRRLGGFTIQFKFYNPKFLAKPARIADGRVVLIQVYYKHHRNFCIASLSLFELGFRSTGSCFYQKDFFNNNKKRNLHAQAVAGYQDVLIVDLICYITN